MDERVGGWKRGSPMPVAAKYSMEAMNPHELGEAGASDRGRQRGRAVAPPSLMAALASSAKTTDWSFRSAATSGDETVVVAVVDAP